ncbi:hypothetical protein BV22DRAFT_311056 [Leucogyrophana mollusca]|uniref:Uncharacterized protein n=1 Tax=Leucogyrophana mollusca TaxID=85980 RepID=A0ACB8BPH2_9AGAM|nr:hypothetical protein BV22DRAFT_311056 [Leucogyrophana mollusca]
MVQITPLLQALAVIAQVVYGAHPAGVNALAGRQTSGSDPSDSNPFSQCSTCGVLETIANCGNATDLHSCLCASGNGQNLATCESCLVSMGYDDASSAQDTVDGWNQDCGGNYQLNPSGGSSGGSPSGGGKGGAMEMRAAVGMAVGLTSVAVGSLFVL